MEAPTTDHQAVADSHSFPESHHALSLDHLSPKVAQIEFDWDALYAVLGEADTLPESDREKLCQALRAVFEFIITARGLNQIGRRAVALSWVVNPDLWDGKSIRQVARYLHCNPVVLSRHTAAARRRFGISHPGCARGWNFKPATEQAHA